LPAPSGRANALAQQGTYTGVRRTIGAIAMITAPLDLADLVAELDR
jgi:hypothetical protein